MKIVITYGIEVSAAELRAIAIASPDMLPESGNDADIVEVVAELAGIAAVRNLIAKGKLRQQVESMEKRGELEIGRANPPANDRRLVRDRSGHHTRRR